MADRDAERANLLMDPERRPQYDGLTTGRFGFSDDGWDEQGQPTGNSGVDVAHVDHPNRWAREYRRLHNLGRGGDK